MKLLLIDGNSIVNRAFYGVRALTTKDGIFTNGIYGFLSIFYGEVETERPDCVCVAFDMKAPTFRHKKYGEYKAGRKGMPDELAMQMPILKEVLDAMNVARVELEGYEADDIIGTLATSYNGEVVVLTGDKDALQLVRDNVTVKIASSRGGKSETVPYTPSLMMEKYGFSGERIVDLKALMGDASDNIPGVKGVGEKTAMGLLQEFGSLDSVYEALEEGLIKPTVAKKLEADRENANLSYDLATIYKEVPMSDTLDLSYGLPNADALRALFMKLEFNRFLKKIEGGMSEQKVAVVMPEALEVSSLDNAKAGLSMSGEFFATDEGLFKLAEPSLSEGLNDIPDKGIWEGKGVPSVGFNAELASYLINPAAKSDAMALCGAYLNRESTIAAYDLHELRPILEQRLEKDGLMPLYKDVEMPLSDLLYEMEQKGFAVDRAALEAFGRKLGLRIEGIVDKIEEHVEQAGFEGKININSPKQLGELLFDRLELPHGKKTKTGWSTDAETLDKLAKYHPVVALILEYRKLTKLLSTYVVGMLALIGEDGRVHTTFKQAATLTGRLSSVEPNLQNIPVREELGRELRRMFIAPEGHVLLGADYSQIELRVLAHISGDAAMTKAFTEGGDIHSETALRVFGSDDADMRRRAKAVNFGIVYGISDFSLAGDIGVKRSEAKQFIEDYFSVYSGVKAYLDGCIAKAKEEGYVTTMMGRRRYIPELADKNFNRRSFGERAAMNTPIQGSAADIIKLAMVKVAARLKREGLRAALILQVHDELIVEAPIEEVAAASVILKEEMEGAYKMSVPLVAEVKEGASWYDTK